MAQDDFTKEECTYVRELLLDIFASLTPPKQRAFDHHLHDIYSFLQAAHVAAPKADSVAAARPTNGPDVVKKEA